MVNRVALDRLTDFIDRSAKSRPPPVANADEYGPPVSLDIEHVLPDKDNMELAAHETYRGNGPVTRGPLKVHPVTDTPGKYALADGHHRLLESILGGESAVTVRVHPTPASGRGTVVLDPDEEHYGLGDSLKNGWLLRRMTRNLSKPTPVVNAGKRFAPGAPKSLAWHETADAVEPGPRGRGGVFVSRGENLVGRSGGGLGFHQENLATADERAHGEFHSAIPRATVDSIYNGGPEQTGYLTPLLIGNTSLLPVELHPHLAAAGFLYKEHPVLGGYYHHPATGSLFWVNHSNSGGSRVRYEPYYDPDHPDDMSRAADAASLKAHLETGQTATGSLPRPKGAADKTAGLHREAAFAHSVAKDKAEGIDGDEPRPLDAANHSMMQKYHEAVAARLERGE